MNRIHTLEILPSQRAINLVAGFYTSLQNKNLNYENILADMKGIILENEFLSNYDGSVWMEKRGIDYFNNPKLFSNAPLTYLCVFLGECFKKYNLNELLIKLPEKMLEKVLSRLTYFIQ